MSKNNIMAIVVLFASLFVFAGCGDDSPTDPTPRGGGGNNPPAVTDVTVSVDKLDFGVVCFGSDKKMTVRITADSDNTEDVTGEVSLSSSTSYNITSGGGAYTLSPGQTRIVTVRYNPQRLHRTHQAVVLTGIEGLTVTCTGYSSERPWIRLEPHSSGQAKVTSNYEPFMNSNAVTPLMHTNIDYELASWQQCRSKALVCNGNSTTESTFGLELKVPSGTTRLEVTIMMEVEDECTQFMVEVDGTEHVWEGYSGSCREYTFTVPISPGTRRIRVGTDQSALCGGDLAVWEVQFEFNRACLSPDEVY